MNNVSLVLYTLNISFITKFRVLIIIKKPVTSSIDISGYAARFAKDASINPPF